MEIIRWITSSNTLPGGNGPWLHLVAILYLSVTLVAKPVEEIQLNEAAFYVNHLIGSCQLPTRWHGMWYFILDKSDVASMKISNTSIDIRGECKNQLNDQYLFVDVLESGEKCWRFMLFFEKHPNVIHFKETECLQYPNTIQSAIEHFLDNPRITMFRANPQQESCPIEGPFYFNYSLSDSLCSSHTSRANSCASNHRLRFTFESCPEVPSSNKGEDDIQCFANWFEGGKHYFAAKLLNNDNEAQQYRCFYFEKHNFPNGVIGRSADASCRALDNLKMFYTIGNKMDGYCKSFPHWLIHDHHDHNRKRRWESLMDTTVVHDFHRHEWIVRRNGEYDLSYNVSISVCLQKNVVEDTFVEFVVHTVKGCENYDHCVRIYRRSDQVIEILEGAKAPNFGRIPESICSHTNFLDAKYETLLLESSAEKQCPDRGRYSIEGCNDQYSEMFFGCSLEHQFVIDYKCEEGFSGTYNCHGHWKENDTNFLIVREQNTGKKRCFVYTGNHEHLVVFDYRLHPCKRGILSGLNNHRVYNASKSNLCNPVVESQIGTSGSTAVLINYYTSVFLITMTLNSLLTLLL